MRNTGRISSSDGNLIFFENLDIPIAIEVPRFPIICTFISIFFGFFGFGFQSIILSIGKRYYCKSGARKSLKIILAIRNIWNP
jgi:hypothetical protein